MQAIRYRVTSCHRGEFPAEARIGGKVVPVNVPGLIIEASSEDGSMGHTFRFVPDDVEAAEAEFAVGNTIVASLEGTSPEG